MHCAGISLAGVAQPTDRDTYRHDAGIIIGILIVNTPHYV